MAVCPAFDGSEPYVAHVLAFVDCHALALGQDGWGALGPGSAWATALSGLMTLSVALIGYRLLLGEAPNLREGAWLAARLPPAAATPSAGRMSRNCAMPALMC